jgi:S1-C subfamily serine protease
VSRRALLAAGLLAGLAVPGCGGSGGGGAKEVVKTVETTKVEVVRGLGSGGAFDPTQIYKREAPGVVTVLSVFGGGGGLLGLSPGGGGARGLGSGFVISAGGEVATNAHVVTNGEGRDIQRAKSVFVKFGDGNQVPAQIVGTDANSDVALLRVKAAGLTLRPLPLGTSTGLVVGSPVAAIGSPFGEPQSLSVGVISATDRTIESLTSFQIDGAIQTDAAVNHGNSGGPLVNARGQVIGINSQIRSTGGGGEGVGFAVPIDVVKRSLDQLRATGHVNYAFIGVSTVAVFPQLARRFALGVDHGAWIQQLSSDAPAKRAGLRAGSRRVRFEEQDYQVGGDVITAIDKAPIRKESDLSKAIEAHRPGQSVQVEIWRGGTRRTVTVRLAQRPTDVGRRRP